MADYPAHGVTDWDIALKAYLDDMRESLTEAIGTGGGGGGGGGGDLAVVTYTGSSATARPDALVVIWLGFPTQPDHMVDGDLWLSPAGGAFLTGTAIPDAGVGNNGDVYLRKTTGVATLYGPKAAGAWPTGVNLIGAPGTNGTNGHDGVPLPVYSAPAGTVRANLPRADAMAFTTPVSGTLYLTELDAYAGDVFTAVNARAMAGSTGLTHSWAVLCDANRKVLAVSADNTTAVWGSDTTRTWPFVVGGSAAPYTIPTSGFYYVGIMLAGTDGSCMGAANHIAKQHAIPPITCGSSDTLQTAPPAIDSIRGALTATGVFPWLWLT